jgi:hypothetical protein
LTRTSSLAPRSEVLLIVGFFGVVVLYGVPVIGGLYTEWAGTGTASLVLRALVASICLLPPTLLMGATLPVVARGVEVRHITAMPGPTGESNELRCRGRGVFVCISPWNFPLSIFVGQVAAALAAGNAVVAKPATIYEKE